jgi:N-methylhydantoinase A
MTVQRGIDPRAFALLAFGGAGPVHACALAEELGISRVLCPRAGGVLSALGLVAAAPRHDAARSVLLAFGDDSLDAVACALAEVRERAAGALGEGAARTRALLELRYVGQSFELSVDAEPLAGARERFERAHERRYGYRDPAAAVEVVTVRATAWGRAPEVAPAAGPARVVRRARQPMRVHGALMDGELRVGEPAPGTSLRGPAVWALPGCTLVVPPGWEGGVDVHGTIVLVGGGR